MVVPEGVRISQVVPKKRKLFFRFTVGGISKRQPDRSHHGGHIRQPYVNEFHAASAYTDKVEAELALQYVQREHADLREKCERLESDLRIATRDVREQSAAVVAAHPKIIASDEISTFKTRINHLNTTYNTVRRERDAALLARSNAIRTSHGFKAAATSANFKLKELGGDCSPFLHHSQG